MGNNKFIQSVCPLKIYILLMVNLLLYVKMTTEFFTVPNGSSWTQTSIPQAQQMTDPLFAKQWLALSYGYGKWTCLS